MQLYHLDPMKDVRWAELTQRHPKASVFHTVEWLQALRCTYGYESVVYTTSPPTRDLENGLVFCCVDSWLTGRRLVSLPFSDHCEPLCDSRNDDLTFLLRYLQTAVEHQKWRYLEFRPITASFGQLKDLRPLEPSGKYHLHILDLRPALDEVFRSLHKNSVQRRIQRGERGGLVERCGRSEELLRDFYSMFVTTRARHHLPPSPKSWFRNLLQAHGNVAEVRLAYKDEIPISGILTLRFKDTVFYKYGCSDQRFNRFGATPWLLWRAIVAAKLSGATKFDLGRTEESNVGLLEFKNHWVPRPSLLVYWRFPGGSSVDSADGWQMRLAKRVFSCMPDRLLTIAGNVIYRHMG